MTKITVRMLLTATSLTWLMGSVSPSLACCCGGGDNPESDPLLGAPGSATPGSATAGSATAGSATVGMATSDHPPLSLTMSDGAPPAGGQAPTGSPLYQQSLNQSPPIGDSEAASTAAEAAELQRTLEEVERLKKEDEEKEKRAAIRRQLEEANKARDEQLERMKQKALEDKNYSPVAVASAPLSTGNVPPRTLFSNEQTPAPTPLSRGPSDARDLETPHTSVSGTVLPGSEKGRDHYLEGIPQDQWKRRFSISLEQAMYAQEKLMPRS
jgi:hypothetical protein